MGGQRKGSLKERSELEFSNQRKQLLNFAIFGRQHHSENDGGRERRQAVVALSARYVLLKKQHERLVNYNESRIGQSTCSAKRDFTTFFDDAERYNEQTCLALFRFKMEEIDKLVEILSLNERQRNGEPFQFVLPNRCTFTGKEGLLLCLAYLNTGKPFLTLLEEGFTFGASPNGSQLVNVVVRFLYYRWAGPLLHMPLKMWLRVTTPTGHESRAEYYRRCISDSIEVKSREILAAENLSRANAVQLERMCEQVKNTTFYCDGTDIEVCRPEENQEAFYNGRKKCHVISYQGIVAPDGLMVRLGGAYEGRVHDARAYREEGFEYELKDMCEEFEGDDGGGGEIESDDDDDVGSFTIFADSAYSMTKYTKRPYKKSVGGHIGVAKRKYNGLMSSCRTDVENAFCLVKMFKWMGSKYRIKLLQSIQRGNDEKPAHDMSVYVSCFLTNLRTCLRWNQISTKNKCVPPRIEVYLSMRDMYLNDG